MKNKKGFTLIELLAVIIIIGLLIAIAFPAVSKYIVDTRRDTYSLHEAELKSATANMMSECVQGNVDGCVPDNGESRTIYLNELIAQKYSDKIKDPARTETYCSESDTYVVVTNSKNNVVNLDYQVCLVCSEYKSEICETVKPNDTCDKTTDPERPVCGDAVGASTVWTNADRIISIGCSDTGCGCTQGTFYKRFEENAKQGVITVVDKAGNSTDCVVDVYVDKEIPTCSLTVEGNQGENGWYGGSAPVVKLSYNDKDISGIATYGMGVSSKNYDLNKKTSYTVSPGITTVYGYVKDNAGNVGTCKAEVKYDNVVPTSDITYGYQVYPKDDIATVSGQNITLNNFISEYGTILGANIYLKSNTSGMSVTIYKGSTEIAKRTISAGVTFMKFSFSGNYDGLTIDMGSTGNLALIERVELITDQTVNGFYTNQDVIVYATSKDSFSGKGYYSFDGSAWQTDSSYTYGSNVSNSNVKIKDYAGNISDPVYFDITNIDKEVPSCSITTEFEPNGKNDWFTKNFGLQLHTSDIGVSNVRDYNITTNSNPSYGTTTTGTQTEDTKKTTWHGYVRDHAGNVNRCSIDVKLDKVDPVCEVTTAFDPDAENGWYKSTVNVSFKEKDDTAGVVFRDITTSSTPSYNMVTDIDLDYDTQGETFYCYVEDESGRTGTNHDTFYRDTVLPECEIVPDRAPDGDNNWYIANVGLTLKTSDATSLVNGFDMLNGTTIDYTKKRTTATINTSTASITYNGYVRDTAGHKNSCTLTVKLEKENPTCTIDPTEVSTGDNSWYTKNITFKIVPSKATAPLVDQGIDGSVSWDFNDRETYTHSADQTGIVYYGMVLSESGRKGSCSSNDTGGPYKKDSTPPASCSLSVTSGTPNSNGWYTVDVGLSMTVPNHSGPYDATSGVAGYDITNGDPNYSNKIVSYTVTSDNNGNYYGYIKDKAGNKTTCSVPVPRDTTRPECYLSVSGTQGLSGWYTSGVSVLMPADNRMDATSGIAAYGMARSYSVNYDGAASLGASSGTYLRFYGFVKDKAGNTNWCFRYVRGIDLDDPTCSVEVTEGEQGDNDWYTSSIVKLGIETSSGVANYGLSTSSYVVYNGLSTISRYGNTKDAGVTYNCYVMDPSGRTGKNSKTIKKDSTKPYCYMSLEGTKGANDWYTSSSVIITGKASDYNSGLSTYALNNSSTESFTSLSGVSKSGNIAKYTHYSNTDSGGITYYCWAKDKAGNVNNASSASYRKHFKKDSTAPSCSLRAKSDGSGIFNTGAVGWTTAGQTFSGGEVTIGWNSKSSDVISYGLTTSTTPTYNMSDTISFDQDSALKTYYGYVMDEAGNEGYCSNSWGRDTGEPICTISVTSGTLGGNNWYRSNVGIAYNVYDGDDKSVSWDKDVMTFKRGSTSLTSTTTTASSEGTNNFYGTYTFSGWFGLTSTTVNCDLSVKIDKTAPTMEVELSTSSSKSSPSHDSVTVTLSGSDSRSGINYWYYRSSASGTWYPIYSSKGKETVTLTYSNPGNNSKYFRVCDVAGNCTSSTYKSIWIDPCDNPPDIDDVEWGTCEEACGTSEQKRTVSWTGDTGATCKIEQTQKCEDFTTCDTAHNLCEKYSDNYHEALFGSNIGAVSDGYRNWGTFHDVSPKMCFTCSSTVWVATGYERICYSSTCGRFRGMSAQALYTLEMQEIESGLFGLSYSDAACPSVSYTDWCSCMTNKNVIGGANTAGRGLIHRQFAQDVISCGLLSEEDEAALRPGDPCYQT